MTRGARLATGTLAAALLLGALGFLTRLPYDSPGAELALLRLSWRVRLAGELVCRTLSEEELAALPAHMRRAEECVRTTGEYALRVSVDGRVVADTVINGAGVRADRPLSMFREITLPPGRYDVVVDFGPVDVGNGGGAARGGKRYDVRAGVDLGAGDVALVTLDEEADALVVRTPARD